MEMFDMVVGSIMAIVGLWLMCGTLKMIEE
jgi:hypothetical protein